MHPRPEITGRGRHSGGDGDRRDLVSLGQAPAFRRAALQRQGNRLEDVGKRLLSRAALRDAAWDQRALGDWEAVLAGGGRITGRSRTGRMASGIVTFTRTAFD